ncbi:TIGR03943 family putative permease subunit [Microbacterium sp. CPCC 204701]|uniref:TIGR03943 family putative permease subunit n=1 Tax=Microbacterium sp. CPCC 204701 TaxID=2493084 RepID=UPI00197B6CDA|nr:TIGR03943 family protein [Microbacterium sp. CPCC 204701]
MRSAQFVGTRWLGVGLASILAVVTLSLAVTGRLGLYINPDSTWFAVSMAVVVLAGAVASFALPLGAESDHGHDHGGVGVGTGSEDRRSAREPEFSPLILRHGDEPPTPATHDGHVHGHAHEAHGGHDGHVHRSHPAAVAATMVGGIAASGVVVLTLVLPPASLSAELAMSRDVGAAPLFGGADTIQLASTGDTASFGVGEWSTAFATATNPDAFDGDAVELTGFVTPGEDGDFDITRLVITHCVIDAQPASVPVVAGDLPTAGQWVTVTGTVRASSDGRLVLEAASVDEIPEPEDPYEY